MMNNVKVKKEVKMKKIFLVLTILILVCAMFPMVLAKKCLIYNRVGDCIIYEEKPDKLITRITKLLDSKKFDKLYGDLDKRMCPIGGSGADACICVYQPVCGYTLIKGKKLEPISYSNSCFACMNERVLFYTSGGCE